VKIVYVERSMHGVQKNIAEMIVWRTRRLMCNE